MSYANIDASSGEVVATVTSDSEHIKELEKRIDELEKARDFHIESVARHVEKSRKEIIDKNKRLDAALAELLRLKNLKDTQGKTPEYLRDQPKAWEQARKARVGNDDG